MLTVDRPIPRYRKLAGQWFDFELTHHEKSALLQAFPKVYELLQTEVHDLAFEVPSQPKNKEALLDTIALAFFYTLGADDQQRLKTEQELPKDHLREEMANFLRQLKIACLRANHHPNFKTR